MPIANIAEPSFRYTGDDPEGFRSGICRLGPALGATTTGVSVYELPPGQSLCPYHYEYGEEEWLLVLAGTPTLRTPGEQQLQPWDITVFAKGPDGAHGVRNDTDSPVRVLMFSEVRTPAATVYPDSDKIGIWTGNDDDNVIVRRSSNVKYFDGETES